MTTLANCFCHILETFEAAFLATFTRCLFCSSVNRCGTHLAEIFLTFKCFFKIRWTVDSDMPTFRAISRTVNLASPSMISFILETISLRDADFGLPDFGAFLMDSTPDSNFCNTHTGQNYLRRPKHLSHVNIHKACITWFKKKKQQKKTSSFFFLSRKGLSKLWDTNRLNYKRPIHLQASVKYKVPLGGQSILFFFTPLRSSSLTAYVIYCLTVTSSM